MRPTRPKSGWAIGRGLALALAALLALAGGTASAQSPFGFADPVGEGPALIDADTMTYDRERDVVVAEGKVIVVQGARALSAARIEYFVGEDRIVASGGVTLLEPGGEVLRAERAELSEGLKRAVAADLGLRLTDGSRLVGRSMRRDSGVETVVKQAAFTPCALCEEDPERPPIWRLRARKVTHDEAAKDLEYEDVTLDIAGVPVAYLPYFSHPDPTVKRRSGLLAPTLYFGGDLKAIAQVPYFVNIGPNEDLTFQPYFTLKSAPVPALEYRRLFENGEIRFDGSLGKLDREDNSGREKGDVVRGHAFVDGRFDLDETWRLSFDGKVASDDSYLETFHIDSADVLRSTAAVEGFWREDYVRIGAFAGHDLRESADQNDTPFALPELRAALVGAPGRLGYPFLDADARVLGRNQGTSGESASATAGWRAPLFTPDGHRFDLEASVRGDVYDTRNGEAIGARDSDTSGRVIPRLVAGWRYPVIQQNDWGALVLEPRAQIVAALDGGSELSIPNEDSRAIEFDENNFFSPDRFPGRDLVDDGQRVDYGLTATALFASGLGGGRASAFVGQSVSRKAGDFARESGMGRVSDVVAAATVAPSDWVDLTWRGRFDRETFDTRRQEIAVGGGPEWLRLSAAYVQIDSELQGPERSFAAEQLKVGAAVRFLDYYTVAARHHADLDDNRSLLWAASLSYQDECISVDLGIERDFASQADGGGREDSIFLRVNFKHLGGLGLSQGFGRRDDDRP